jgi:hypothetical protein
MQHPSSIITSLGSFLGQVEKKKKKDLKSAKTGVSE